MRGPWGQCVATWLLYLSWEWWSDLGVSVCGHFTAVSVIVNEGTLGSVCVATSLFHISQCEWEDLRGWVWPLHCSIYPSVSKRTLGVEYGDFTAISYNEVRRPCGQCLATSLQYLSLWMRGPWGQCVWPPHCSIYPSVSKMTMWGLSMATSLLYLTMRWEDLWG